MSKVLNYLPLLILCCSLPSSGTSATVLLRETFEAGSLARQKLPDTAAWLGNFGEGQPTLSLTESSTRQGAYALQISGGTGTRQALAYFDRAAIDLGETLTLSFSFTPQGIDHSTNGWNALRIGLIDSRGQRQSGHRPRGSVATGYSAWVRSNTNEVSLYRREPVSGHLITSATYWKPLRPPASPDLAFEFKTGSTYGITLALTRTEESSVRIEYEISDAGRTFSHTHVDTTPDATTFDGVILGFGSSIPSALIERLSLLKTP